MVSVGSLSGERRVEPSAGIFLHAGVVHYALNMLLALAVGLPLEKKHGPARVGFIYGFAGPSVAGIVSIDSAGGVGSPQPVESPLAMESPQLLGPRMHGVGGTRAPAGFQAASRHRVRVSRSAPHGAAHSFGVRHAMSASGARARAAHRRWRPSSAGARTHKATHHAWAARMLCADGACSPAALGQRRRQARLRGRHVVP